MARTGVQNLFGMLSHFGEERRHRWPRQDACQLSAYSQASGESRLLGKAWMAERTQRALLVLIWPLVHHEKQLFWVTRETFCLCIRPMCEILAATADPE